MFFGLFGNSELEKGQKVFFKVTVGFTKRGALQVRDMSANWYADEGDTKESAEEEIKAGSIAKCRQLEPKGRDFRILDCDIRW
jgi:hypothetical protein